MKRFDWGLAGFVWSLAACIGAFGGMMIGVLQDLLTG